MFKSIRGLSGWWCKDCSAIYIFWRKRIMKQDDLGGDPKFTTIIGFGGKSSSYWMKNKRQSWKWRRVYGNYRNPISESDVGLMNSKNIKKTCKAHVVSTISDGKVWTVDWWFLEKAQLQTTKSMERDAVKLSPKWVDAIYFSVTICGLKL
jgi:hypothetical protein